MLAFKDIDFHRFIEGLVKTIELRDVYTAGHSKRVSELTDLICRELGMSDKECEYIHVAAHLHDIGKIGIPDGILLKTGKLSSAEYFVMQQHSSIGAAIFENQEGFRRMAAIIRQHHERHDGRGYPDRLKGDEILEGAAIIAVADSFDAMTTSRTYRAGISPEEAMEEIRKNRGTQFNPVIADAFCRSIESNEHRINLIISSYNYCNSESVYFPFNSMSSDHNPDFKSFTDYSHKRNFYYGKS